VADLFLFCYESEFMKNLSKSNDLNLIEKFNTSFRYLDDLCSLDNSLFHTCTFVLTLKIFTLKNLFSFSQK